MTPKQKLITDFLKRKQGRAFYLDLHDCLVFDFDDEEDLNNTLDEMSLKDVVLVMMTGEETEYVLNEKKLKK